jgi:uncharacterized membrane protein
MIRQTGASGPTWRISFIAMLLLAIFLFRGRLRQILQLPLALGVIAWSAGAHLLANGDQASVILFGGLLLYALVHIGFRPGARHPSIPGSAAGP